MARRLQPVLANLALLGFSLLVALAGAELILRLAPGLLSEEARLRLSWQEQRLSHTARTRPDSAIGFLYVPGGHAEVKQGEVHFSYTTDADGFRNAEPRPERAEIVAVGDSWTFGFGVDDSAAWTRILDDSLRPARVVNLGLIGAGPAQYTRVLERFGLPLHPRVILYGVFPGNDLDDQEAFDAWQRAGVRGNFAEWRTYGERGRSQPLWQRSYLAVAVEEGWKYRGERFAGRTIRLADGSPLQLSPARLVVKLKRSRPGEPAFDHVLAAVAEAREAAERTGAHLVVLVFPTKEEVYLPLRGEPAPELVARWLPELRRFGAPVVDLTGALQGRPDGPPLFFEVDGHANVEGNRVLAAAVLDYLRGHAAELGLSSPAR